MADVLARAESMARRGDNDIPRVRSLYDEVVAAMREMNPAQQRRAADALAQINRHLAVLEMRASVDSLQSVSETMIAGLNECDISPEMRRLKRRAAQCRRTYEAVVSCKKCEHDAVNDEFDREVRRMDSYMLDIWVAYGIRRIDIAIERGTKRGIREAVEWFHDPTHRKIKMHNIAAVREAVERSGAVGDIDEEKLARKLSRTTVRFTPSTT